MSTEERIILIQQRIAVLQAEINRLRLEDVARELVRQELEARQEAERQEARFWYSLGSP